MTTEDGWPVETVTFLFTDVEKSTRQLQQTRTMLAVLLQHLSLLTEIIEAQGGRVFKTVGDAVCAVFEDAVDAVVAAVEAQRALQREMPDLRVRMALHTGSPEYVNQDSFGRDYFGLDLSRAGRLVMAGHGGQVLLSQATVERVRDALSDKADLRSLGKHRLRDLPVWEEIFQLQTPGLRSRFPPLNTMNVAFRRGVRRALAISSVVIVLLVGLTLRAVSYQRLAEDSRRNERRQRYVAQMNLGFEALEARRCDRLRYLLEAQRPKPGEEDLRGFEWRYLWRRAHRDRLTLTLPDGCPGDLRFLPDGNTFVTNPTWSTVRRWQVAKGQLHATYQRPVEADIRAHPDLMITAQAFSPDGRTLAVARLLVSPSNAPRPGARWEVRSWDWSSGMQEKTVGQGQGQRLDRLVFSPDGRRLAGIAGNPRTGTGVIKVWDRISKRETTLRGPEGTPMLSLTFSPDGKLLAAIAADGSVRVWDVAEGRHRLLLQGPTYKKARLAFSPDGRTLAVGGASAGGPGFGRGSLRVWDLATRRGTNLIVNEAGILTVAFSPNGRFIAASTADGTVHLWDAKTGRKADRLEGHKGQVYHLAFSPDSQTLATAGADSTVRLWDVGTLPPPDAVDTQGADGAVTDMAFSPDGRQLATLGWEGTIRQREVSTAQEIARRAGAPSLDSPDRIAFDARYLAVSHESVIRLWDRVTGQDILLRNRGQTIFSLAFVPGAQTLVAGTKDGALEFWCLITHKSIRLGLHAAPVVYLAFSLDGDTLATVDETGLVNVWKTAAMTEVAKFQAGPVSSAAFSPDGTMLAMARGPNLILRLISTGREVSFPAHERDVEAVAFTPDGRTVATLSSDGLVKLWHATTGQELGSLDASGLQIRTAAFSPDGNTLVAGDAYGALRFWRADSLAEADGVQPRR